MTAKPTPPPDPAGRLIVALDVPDIAAARDLVHALDGVVSVFKVGPWLHMARGFEDLVDDLVGGGKQVFLDMKGCDIPETMRAASATAAARGIRFLTIHGNDEVSDEAMIAAVDGKAGSALQVLAVTVLTSNASSPAGATGAPDDLVLTRAGRALALGCDGVIASGREAAAIRALAKKRPFLIVTPGIRPASDGIDDHKRAVTPAAAIAAGADYLVVGRPIVRASDPAAAAAQITAEMADAFRSRASL